MRSSHTEQPPESAERPGAIREGRRISIRGTVQGVGFRPWVFRVAREAQIAGRVRNDAAGVTIDAFGAPDQVRRFVERLASSPPAAASIDELRSVPIPFEPLRGFDIVVSHAGNEQRRIAIPPDLPTCPGCLSEVRDAANRRYRYPFTNCTSCGPRFTIATAAPYDRANTTMAGFRMCPACQHEYDNVQDRRFHAQPNACPVCGPTLKTITADGVRLEGIDAIANAADALMKGRIVALKGIGGFHLACDATSDAAVAELRARKRRDEKPFAVMVRDIERARAIAILGQEEERLLQSAERPIVLVERQVACQLSDGIAPRNRLVGLLLPYSPLHHLLLDLVDPLVMTSGNVSDEPIAYTDEQALSRLRGIADLFILHEREIVTRCDDSVARVTAGRPVVLRRSRGYVPRAVRLRTPMRRAVLACGALLKNTFCLALGDEAFLGPHIGDLENLETFNSYRESVARLERFLHFTPEIVAHDLHPDYLSTRYALARHDAIAIGVQHHHAHVASVMAEHGVDGPVIGVAYDGTGLGTDGTSWGGEILVARYAGFERVATFRPITLPGGDAAIRQPWRTALALLDDAFEGDAPLDSIPVFSAVSATEIDVVRRMVRDRLNAPLAHGVGRYFDAMAAIGLGRARSAYEGQLALEWNVVADAHERGRYRYDIVCSSQPWELDLRPAVRDAVFELTGGEPASRVSARFHNTLAAATADLVRGVASVHGRMPVALTGGCCQNARLVEGILHELESEFTVLLHGKVPPGDGGIALGQAVVADAVAAVGQSAVGDVGSAI